MLRQALGRAGIANKVDERDRRRRERRNFLAEYALLLAQPQAQGLMLAAQRIQGALERMLVDRRRCPQQHRVVEMVDVALMLAEEPVLDRGEAGALRRNLPRRGGGPPQTEHAGDRLASENLSKADRHSCRMQPVNDLQSLDRVA